MAEEPEAKRPINVRVETPRTRLPNASRVRRAVMAFGTLVFALASSFSLVAWVVWMREFEAPIVRDYIETMGYLSTIVLVVYIGGQLIEGSGFFDRIGGFWASRKDRRGLSGGEG